LAAWRIVPVIGSVQERAMSLTYLVGPASAADTWRCWQPARLRGACKAWNRRTNLDLSIAPGDGWQQVLRQLLDGWRPDCLVLDVAGGAIPAALWQAPVPIIGLARHCGLRWHAYRRLLPLCDVVVTDGPTAALLRRVGIEHVHPRRLCGLGPTWLGLPPDAHERDIDILFAGSLDAAHWRVRPWLGRLAALAPKRRVLLRGPAPEGEYQHLLRRARVVF
jgi:hypothetical protein